MASDKEEASLQFLPGSLEKVELMEQRYANGEQIFQPHDLSIAPSLDEMHTDVERHIMQIYHDSRTLRIRDS